VSKGARFWGFLPSRVIGILGGISSIPLDLASFGGSNLGYGVPMRCTIPKVLCKSVERFGRSGVGFGGVDPRVVVHPESPGFTGLTSASHRSDWYRPPVGFCSGERVDEFPFVLCGCCFEFGLVWSSEGQVCGFGASWLRPV
jgi:hypothetical protein